MAEGWRVAGRWEGSRYEETVSCEDRRDYGVSVCVCIYISMCMCVCVGVLYTCVWLYMCMCV